MLPQWVNIFTSWPCSYTKKEKVFGGKHDNQVERDKGWVTRNWTREKEAS